jgi:tetratricopeptide (TPR) repeat protein
MRIADSLHKDVDWMAVSNAIREKTNAAIAYRNIVYQKVKFYEMETHNAEVRQDPVKYKWGKLLAAAWVNRLRNTDFTKVHGGFTTSWYYNNNAWTVFQYSDNKDELEQALKWTTWACANDPTSAEGLDTKANILYKLGRTDEAIRLEQQAVSMRPKSTDLAADLKKMQKKQPTWPTNN